MNIYEKMSAITTELNAVAKNLNVGVGKTAYKAVGEADVLAAVKPLESKYKVYSFPVSRDIETSDVIVKKSTYNGEAKESSNFFMRLRTVYRFVNLEDPADYIDITTYGDGIDPGDKAPGKAMTYSDKYALLKAYKIITGDDPDQQASEPGTVQRGRHALMCADCGQPISDAPLKNGGFKPASEIIKYTTDVYGRPLCMKCLRAEMKRQQAPQVQDETVL